MEARNKDTECQRSLLATLVETLSQAIFSAEAAIKILGFGKKSLIQVKIFFGNECGKFYLKFLRDVSVE